MNSLEKKLREYFEWFHRHPELSYEEYGTTKRIREILEEDFPDWEKRIRNGDRLIKERFS